MERRKFVRNIAAIAASGAVINSLNFSNAEASETKNGLKGIQSSEYLKPRAITMWDFSWLERRWPGAGYEDWDKALNELIERGYNAVRIDAYPHLVSENPSKVWTLNEVWNTQMWGSPDVNSVQVQPALNQFIAKCKQRDIKVGLSTWFRQDVDKTLMKINSAQKMAEIWIKTLDSIAKENLLDAILYVDLCNEWPGDLWCPFFKNDPPDKTWGYWHTDKSMQYMKESIELVEKAYPQLPYTYSFTGGEPAMYAKKDLSFFGLLEHHVWMAQVNNGEYYNEVGYKYERFSPEGFKNLAKNGELVYKQRRDYWQKLLNDEINLIASSAKTAKLPLITTECWSLVDYKDWPLLKWDWLKELCELGVTTSAQTGQWLAIASSNFCGPQFVGMWRDVEWHKKITNVIKSAQINPELKNSKLYNRL